MNRWKRRRGGEIGRISGSARHAYRLVSRNPTVACKTVSNRRHDDLRTRTALTARTGLHRSSDCHCEGRRQGGRRCVHAPVFSAAKPKPDAFDSVLFLFCAQHARPESGCRCTAISKNASNAARAIFRLTEPLRRAPRAFQGAAEIHAQIAACGTENARTQPSDVHALSGVSRIAAARTYSCMPLNVRARVGAHVFAAWMLIRCAQYVAGTLRQQMGWRTARCAHLDRTATARRRRRAQRY